MSYVDAGYVIALSVLTGYAATLLLRRRRLARAAALADPAGAPADRPAPAVAAPAGPEPAPVVPAPARPPAAAP